MIEESNRKPYPKLTDINQHGHYGIRTGQFSSTEPPGEAVEGRRSQGETGGYLLKKEIRQSNENS